MKKIFTLILAATFVISAFSQVREQRTFQDFSEITASTLSQVVLTQSDTYSVEVEAPEEVLSKVKITQSGKRLEITSTISSTKNEKITVYISMPNLEKVKVSGASSVNSNGLFKTESITLHSSGASTIQLSVNTPQLNVDASGASVITLSGYAETLKMNVGGASVFEGKELTTINTHVNLSGASHAYVYVEEDVSGEISGSSNLNIKGGKNTTNNVKTTGVARINGEYRHIIHNNDVIDDIEIKNDVVGDIKYKQTYDTTVLSIGNKRVIIVEDYDKTRVDVKLKDTANKAVGRWSLSGMILGVNGYANSSNTLNIPAGYEFLEADISRSVNFQINVWDPKINLYKNYITLHSTVGFDFNSYELRKNYFLNKSSDDGGEISAYRALNADSSAINFRKNRLKTTYLNVPLMVTFHTNKNHRKAFHLGVGGYAGVRLGSKMKYKYPDGSKIKERNDYYLNPFRYGAVASVGYGRVNLFANYAFSNLFENNKGPELHPFSVGVMILGF